MSNFIGVVIDFARRTHPAERKDGYPDARALGRVIEPDLGDEYPINCQVLVERWPGEEHPYKMTRRREHLPVDSF